MEEKIKLLGTQLGKNRLKLNIDLSEQLATVRGKIVDALYIATTNRELIKVVELCKELNLPFTIVGSGSKLVIPRGRVRGLVIKNRSDNLKIFGVKGKVTRGGIGVEEAYLEADSGTSLKKLAEFADQEHLTGLKGLRLELGTIGGSFFVSSVLRAKASRVKVLKGNFGLIIKQPMEVSRDEIIISVIFKLKSQRM